MQLIIELPSRERQLEFNRIRWEEVLSDRGLADLPYRIETNAHGQITMNPPASGDHSRRQGEIAYRIRHTLGGQALPECPVSTIDGVKVCDVCWYSDERFSEVEGQTAFEAAPEICVEVLSPSNTETEIRTKRQLYFEAGAEEVWLCNLDGSMSFFHRSSPDEQRAESRRCPEFPATI